MIAGLSLPERAEMLGLSARELVALAQEDPRIVAPAALATESAVARTRSWLTRGRPAADLASLAFAGDSSIERVVRETLATLPVPVQVHVVETCAVLASGEESSGWCGPLPPLPGPADSIHVIVLTRADPDLFAHEIGHSWSAPTGPRTAGATIRETREEERQFARGVAELALEPELLRTRLRREREADALASLWLGRVIDTCGPARTRGERERIGAWLAAAEESSCPR